MVGGRGRGFTDPPPGDLLAPEIERVLRITGQVVALGLADAGRAASWLAAPSPAQRRWLRDALGWSTSPAPPSAPALPLPALALAAATAAALVAMWLGAGMRRRRDSAASGAAGVAAATAAAAVAAGAIVVVAGATALFRRA